MQKIRLDLADLHIETFAATPSPKDGQGTVLARGYTDAPCWTDDPCTSHCPALTLECSYNCEKNSPSTGDCPEEEP